MNVPIPADLQQFVDGIIRSGTYQTEAEVVGEALRLLRKREELRREVDAGVRQLDEGQGIDGEEVFKRLERKADDLAHRTTAQD